MGAWDRHPLGLVLRNDRDVGEAVIPVHDLPGKIGWFDLFHLGMGDGVEPKPQIPEFLQGWESEFSPGHQIRDAVTQKIPLIRERLDAAH